MPIENDSSLVKLHMTPLSSLPLDALALIADHLPPYDLLYLSHTCKVLRAVAGRRLPEHIRNLARSLDRWSFIAALADASLDYWACIACFQLHAVNLEDNPTNNVEYPRWGSCNGLLQSGYQDDDRATRLKSYAGNYETKLRHVQLSLKYKSWNHLDAPYRKHLKELMAPFHMRLEDPAFGPLGLPPPYAKSRDDLIPIINYQATPKILKQHIDGSSPVLKYILHEEWQYKLSRLYSEPPSMASERTFLRFRHKVLESSDCCKHQITTGSQTPALDMHIECLIEKPLGQRISFSCRKCPTDYEMWFEELAKGRGRRELLVLHVWKDMRTSEDDWKRRIRCYYDMGNGPFVQDFTPGDARYLYENIGHLPQHTCVDVDEVTPPGLGSFWQKIWNAVVNVFGGWR